MSVIISVIAFIICITALFFMQQKKLSFNTRIITGLVGGILFGAVLHNTGDAESVNESLRWIGIIGNAYVRLLRMMAIPLIFVSIVCAIINQKSGSNLGRITALVLTILLGTAAVSATVGGTVALAFGLTSEGLEIGDSESARQESLEQRAEDMTPLQETIVNIIPENPLYALSGQGESATLAVVMVACLLGIGVIGVRTYAPEQAEFFQKLMNSLNTLVVEVVMMILMLTPYGVLSLMARTIAGSDYASIMRLAAFVAASYIAIIIMMIIHGLILALSGLSPLIYFKKSLTALTFAFTSRTSAGTLPLTVRSLTEKMGVDNGIANLASSLGVSIGQNGCAGIYPAMLVIMVAPAAGKPITPGFFIIMVIVITFASIGIAGVGGGATFAGITVLSALGLPVGIAGLLVAIEPLIDMARTALNVSDGMITALVTARITNGIDKNIYNDKNRDFENKSAVKSS